MNITQKITEKLPKQNKKQLSFPYGIKPSLSCPYSNIFHNLKTNISLIKLNIN